MAHVALCIVLVVIVVVVAFSVLLSFVLTENQDELKKMGVGHKYAQSSLPTSRIESYLDMKERMRQEYGTEGEDRQWMSALPAHAKDSLKYRLMQRAIGDAAASRRIVEDSRGYWRLYSKGIVTRTFWESVLDAEKELAQELENVKLEASCLEPRQDPQGIISEAMQFFMRYGDRLPDAPDVGEASDPALVGSQAQAPIGAKPPLGRVVAAGARGPPTGPTGPTPPSMQPPTGMMVPPRGPPPPQKGGQEEGYTWKQDGDELEVCVDVPREATKSQIKVSFAAKKLKVEHNQQVLLEGQLAAVCVPEGSTWTISRGKVVISLEKSDPRPWPGLFAPMA
mmetsp:Transcript_15874/g.45225  ORF Transcript_15874/g.45225 Transcript_15874/m.45225 type:complete len:338 (-) Transcript_15874:68-1081(-)